MIDSEYFSISKNAGQKQKLIAEDVERALEEFCEQEPEFEQAIQQSDKSFEKCLDKVVEGVGSKLSDLQAYQRAVEFYFPGAEIEFTMTIKLAGSVDAGTKDSSTHEQAEPVPPITMTKSKSALVFGLDALLEDL